MTRTAPRLVATAGTCALALVAAGTAAQARPPVDTFTDVIDDTFSVTCDLGTADTGDDLVLEIHSVGTVDVVVRERIPGVPQFSAHGRITDTQTNVDTGRSWMVTNHFTDKDVRVLSVDGDLVTLRVHTAFHFTVFDEDGHRFASNNGLAKNTVVLDLGTDEVVSEDISIVGHLGARDVCEDAVDFTTG